LKVRRSSGIRMDIWYRWRAGFRLRNADADLKASAG
jgi:hypothetical protein